MVNEATDRLPSTSRHHPSSTKMADKIPSGAFVIRNRHSMTVLHIETATLDSDHSRVIAFEQDENRYRDNQIWWIEPFSHQDRNGGTLYSITNTACGKILDEENSGRVCAAKPHGGPWQAWRIVRVGSDDEGVAYTIIGTRTSYVIGIKTPAINAEALEAKPTTSPKGPTTDAKHDKAVPKSDAACHTQKHLPGEDRQCWEFVIPAVSFPVGWFQVQNFATGDYLSHQYLHGPPMLLPPPDTSSPSQYRESWATQWTLAQVETITPSHKYTSGKNTWFIRNRLTEGRLMNNGTSEAGQIVAWARNWGNVAKHLWMLEPDPTSNWTIMNRHTSFLLEQPEVLSDEGTEPVCVNKRYNPKLRNRSWVLRPPVMEKHDEVPPT